MICLSERRIVLQRCEVAEGRVVLICSNKVNCEREEYLIVNEDLLSRSFIWVQRGQVTTDNGDGTFYSCIQEIVIDLLNCSVTLDSLQECLFGEILDYLEFFIPVTDTSRVKTI